MTDARDKEDRRGGVVLGIAARVLEAVGILLAAVFLFVSPFGEFGIHTPLGALRTGSPGAMLGWTAGAWAAWFGVDRFRRCSRPGPGSISPSALSRAEARVVGFLLTGLTLLLWLRSFYRTYEKVILGMRRTAVVPVWEIHVLHAAVVTGTLFLWRELRRTEGGFGALFGAILFALSPLAIYISPHTAFAYVAAVLVLLIGSRLGRIEWTRSTRWVWGCVLVLVVAGIITVLDRAELKWGGSRIAERVLRKDMPAYSSWFGAAGIAALWFTRGVRRRIWLPALAAGVVGVTLAGSLWHIGDVGRVLAMPLAASLVAAGAGAAWRWAVARGSPFTRNVLVLVAIGMLLRIAYDGIRRGISPPDYARRDTPADVRRKP